VEIAQYLKAGDTALHIAAAAYRSEIMTLLLGTGADIGARNRRGAQPLHHATDGVSGSPARNPTAPAETVGDCPLATPA
jgi:ankyrin repeat protein